MGKEIISYGFASARPNRIERSVPTISDDEASLNSESITKDEQINDAKNDGSVSAGNLGSDCASRGP
jgi:hypothetical protein